MKKNNKKGFTLVELLGVIAILALLATIATPAIISLSNKIKGNMYDAKVKLIKETAILYAEKKGLSGGQYTLNKLCKDNMLSPDEGLQKEDCLENPINKQTMGKNCYFKVQKTNGRYKITFPVTASGATNTNAACKGL